jgi:hypothetical protein
MNVTPHVAQNDGRRGGSAIDARTTRHTGYEISQKKRKRIEECFGWLKDIALLRKLKHRGLFGVTWIFTFAAATYNLVRMRKLIPIKAGPDRAVVSLQVEQMLCREAKQCALSNRIITNALQTRTSRLQSHF